MHFVDSGVDTGPIIAQGRCSCLANDTPDTLAHRVLCIEHSLYPWVVSLAARGLLELDGRHVLLKAEALNEAACRGFVIPTY